MFIICSVVIAVHGLFMLWAFLAEGMPKTVIQPPARRLVVQTIALNPGRPPSPSIKLQPLPPLEEEPLELIAVKVDEKDIELEPVIVETQKRDEPESEIPKTKEEEPPLKESKKNEVVINEEISPPKAVPLPAQSPEKPSPPKHKPKEIKPRVVSPVKKTPVKKPKSSDVPAKKEVPKKPEPAKKEKVDIKSPPPPRSPPPPPPPSPPPPPPLPAAKSHGYAAKANADKEKAKIAAAEKQKKIDAEQQAVKIRQQKLLSQAQESIAKIDKSRDKVALAKSSSSGSSFSSPGAISSLQIDALPEGGGQKLSDHEISYRDELAGRLKLLLKLPEYGEVKVKLTLERSGKVAKVVVVAAESAANRKYIEKTIPTLTFSAFGSNFDHAAQFTFSVTLTNDL